METLRGLTGITGGARVQERAAGGGKRGAEAFRRALEQESDQSAPDRPADGQAPVRTKLQQRPIASRREDGATARHVDVIA